MVVSRVLHVSQYLGWAVLYDPSIGVDTPTIKLADSLVPILGCPLVDTDLLGGFASAHTFAAQPQELLALIADVLAGEDPRLMCPLVAGHPHIAEFSSHRRDVAPNVKQPEELGLLLGRVGPGPLASGGHPSLTPPAVSSIRGDPRPHRRRPNRAPTIQHRKNSSRWLAEYRGKPNPSTSRSDNAMTSSPTPMSSSCSFSNADEQ